MKYCVECGNKLEPKFLEFEGMIPYCDKCKEYRFPIFSSAISVVVLNKDRSKVLFIRQYGRNKNVLVAGYINKGENAEEAVYREMKEEIGVEPIEIHFQKSSYWEKSNTLLFNYYAILDSEEIHPNHEVDSYEWYDVNDGIKVVAKGGLAEIFFEYYCENNMKK